jgi:hypothetical protein
MPPKITHMQCKLARSTIIIGSTIKKDLHTCAYSWDVVQWLDGVLCYFYELFTIFL